LTCFLLDLYRNWTANLSDQIENAKLTANLYYKIYNIFLDPNAKH